MIKKEFSKLALALTISLVAVGVQAKTFVFCSEASPEGFNPSLFTTGTTFDASAHTIFNGLVAFKLGTTQIEPGLAESWDVSDDGLEYTFYLRKGVKFHSQKGGFKPTRDFNADDVVFSFARQGDKTHPYHKVSGGSYSYYNSMGMVALVKEIKKIDEYTVKFILSKPEAPFIANMAMPFASIMSAEQAETLLAAGKPEQLDQNPVGTGPFQRVQYQKDSLIRYVANKDYWKGAPKIDKLVFSITPDASVRYAKLKAGECHLMPFPNPADVAEMKKDPDINLMSSEGLNVGYLAFNTQKAPFDNVKVRQALNYAVNKKAIIDAVFQGSGTIAKNPIPPTMWSYNEAINDYPYDIEKAKKLLAEAGVTNLKTNIWAMPVQRPYNPNARRMAEIIQADWAKAGVQADIVSYEWGEYLKRSRLGEHDTALLGWTGDNGDPDNFLAVLLGCDAIGGGNRAMWCYQPFEDKILAAKSISDQSQRSVLYKEAQVIFKEQAPWVTIAHSVVYKPLRKEVQGFVIDPLGGHFFYGVSLK
ncbi:MAG: ABC transporter substrate-binding protein [Psychromonas sp.]